MMTSWTVTPGLENGTYYWHAYAHDGWQRGPCMDVARFTVEGGQGVADDFLARGVRLLGAAPNPAPGAAALRFELGAQAQVSAEVFDLEGRRVSEFGGRFAAGAHALLWDGKDAAGQPVPGGMYLYRLRGADSGQWGRILVVR